MQEYKLQQKHLRQAITKIMSIYEDIESHRTLNKAQKEELLTQVKHSVFSLSNLLNEK